MAQLKDTVILGDLSVTGNIYADRFPNSTTDNAIARYDGTNGKLQNSACFVNDDGTLSILSNSTTLTIGSKNSGFTHFQSSDSKTFYFSTSGTFNGILYPYSNYDLGTTANRWTNIYGRDTLILGPTGFTSPTAGTSGIWASGAGFIEIDGATPFIDFHYNNSTADFTGRIIADNANGLNISPRLGINTSANASYNLYCNGPSYFNGAAYINNRLTINAGTNAPPLTIQSSAGSYSYIRLHNGSYLWDIATINAAAGSAPANSLQFRPSGGNTSCYITNSGLIYGAVWNDYAEYRQAKTVEPGRCVKETPTGIMTLTTKRMEKGCEIISDTFGFAIGQTEECKTPIAATGRVLAYTDRPREEFELGMPVCSGPNGTISQMTEEEARQYPWCIIGTVSEIPTYEEWGTGKVKVNNRIWIRIR